MYSVNEIVERLRNGAQTIEDENIRRTFTETIEGISTNQGDYVIKSDSFSDFKLRGDASPEEIAAAKEQCYIAHLRKYYSEESASFKSMIERYRQNPDAVASFFLYYTRSDVEQLETQHEDQSSGQSRFQAFKSKLSSLVNLNQNNVQSPAENRRSVRFSAEKFDVNLDVTECREREVTMGNFDHDGETKHLFTRGYHMSRDGVVIIETDQSHEIVEGQGYFKNHFTTTVINSGRTTEISEVKELFDISANTGKKTNETITVDENNNVSYTRVSTSTQEATLVKQGTLLAGQNLTMDAKRALGKVETATVENQTIV